jgi:hypothetical protein
MLKAYTDMIGNIEDLSALFVRRDEDSLGLSFGYTYWDFLNLNKKKIVQALQETEKRMPWKDGKEPKTQRPFGDYGPHPTIPDFEPWQAELILAECGGRQLVQVVNHSRVFFTGGGTHLEREQFGGILTIRRTDYLRVGTNSVWVLETLGTKQQEMLVYR